MQQTGAAAAAAALREHGHELIERMAAHLEAIEGGAVSTPAAPRELASRFLDPLPVQGTGAGEIWGDVWERVVADSIQLHHPMYMGHQVAPPLPHAVLADALVSFLNQSPAVWEMAPTGTFVEALVIRWMRELLGYPATSDGTFVSGGSVANLTGILAAREAVFPGIWQRGVGATPGAERAVIFVSAQSHYSMERAVGVLGLGSDAVLAIPDRGGKMDPAALAGRIAEARRAGRVPLAIVATAGSTPTGAFDDLAAIATIAEQEGIWLHVDGAHGASFLLSEPLRPRLRGIARADSVSWDPHKLMFMPISLGAIFVRDHRYLDAAFQQSAPYLFHPRAGEARSHDTGRRTLQCSRRFDALKLWVSLRHYGAEYFAGLLERTVANTERLYELLHAAPDFEPEHVPESNILCFRYLPAGLRDRAPEEADAFQSAVRERYNASGQGWITATVLNGRRVLRVTLMNPSTEEAHLVRLLEGLRGVGATLSQASPSVSAADTMPITAPST
jgi:L-2,4-diaminobutyrate decarboxylase